MAHPVYGNKYATTIKGILKTYILKEQDILDRKKKSVDFILQFLLLLLKHPEMEKPLFTPFKGV